MADGDRKNKAAAEEAGASGGVCLYSFNIPVRNTDMLQELDDLLQSNEAREQFVSELDTIEGISSSSVRSACRGLNPVGGTSTYALPRDE